MSALASRVRRLPVRVRLALAGTLLLPLALAVVFGLVFLRFEGGLNKAIDADLRARADTLAVMVQRDGPGAIRSPAAATLLRPLGAFAQTVDDRGRVLSSTDAVDRVRLLTAERAAAASREPLQTDHGRIRDVGKRSRLVARPLERGGALVVGRSLRDRESANESFGRALLIGGPLALLLSAIACYLAAAAALRPVESMRRRAAEITGAETGARLPVPEADDEIGRLGETLNDMLGRLEEAMARQRELTQNASHELRTPLTVLRSEIELALQHDLDAGAHEAMETALQQAERVSRLADDLLTLAQVEERELPLALETVDLDEVVRRAAAEARHSHRADGRRIAVDSETLIAEADPIRIGQAVRNLIDNALVHGRGTVTVTMAEHDGVVALGVHDEGPGVAPELRTTAFDRFTRGGDGRRPGAGLGLAIVDAIARAHGGSTRLAEQPPSAVVVTFPVRRPPA